MNKFDLKPEEEKAIEDFAKQRNIKRPLENAQFCSRPRKAKILTTGIHIVF
jgi:hypothetical protein